MALELPGRDRDLRRLVAVYMDMVGEGRGGRTVFVAGDNGSGRTALLHALAGELAGVKPRPIVLAGGFEDGRYVPWGDFEPESKVIPLLEATVSLAEPLVPMAGLVGQVLSKSKAAQQLLQFLSGEADRPDPAVLVWRLLRELCEEGPVACLIDDADRAESGWWADLILSVAGRIARELPLLLVLAVEGPQDLGGHQDDEPDSLYAARQLTARGLATWHSLAPLTVEELERWTGSATSQVLRALLDVTGGRAEWAAQQWSQWCQRGAVAQDKRDGRWGFARGGREQALDPVGEVLAGRLKRLVGETDLRTLDRAREVLACAALEGRRFTAEATARALGRERDELIDFLDETLVGDDSGDGVVAEARSIEVSDESGERCLWLYRFNSELDWLTLFHHGLTPDERRTHSLKLAKAMEALYGREAHRVAHTLARLYRDGEEPERASHYRRMGDSGVRRELLLWRARTILDTPMKPQDRAERRRASQVLIAAAEALFHSGPFKEGLAFAEAGHRLAPLRRDQAQALLLTAIHRMHVGPDSKARDELTQLLSLYRELGDRRGEAVARHELATIHLRGRAYDRARAEFGRALKLHRELGNRYGEANAHHQLAKIHLELGAYDRARAEYTRVLTVCRELGDRAFEASARHQLATIDFRRRAFARARAEFTLVLELRRELGDRHGEAGARHQLAIIDWSEGTYDRARAEFTRLLKLYRELGDRHGEAAARQALAKLDE